MQLVLRDHGTRDDDPRVVRLRKLIRRKRSEKRRLEKEIQDLQGSLASLEARRRRRLDPLDDEVHDHLDFARRNPGFSRDVRRAIDRLYVELMATETISPRTVPGLTDDPARGFPGEPNADGACPYCDGNHHHEPRGRTDDAGAGGAHEHQHEHRRGSPPASAPRAVDSDSASLRQIYRNLASRYHPDKASDAATREENERLMREINGAYQSGDIDTLSALSRELGFEISGNGVLEALAAQYEHVKAEVRSLRHDVLGRVVVETRRAEKRGLRPPLVYMEAEIDGHAQHLDQLAEVFRDFRAGRSSRDEFLDALLGEEEEEDVDPLTVMFTVLSSVMEDGFPGPPSRPRGKRSTRGSTNRQRRKNKGKRGRKSRGKRKNG